MRNIADIPLSYIQKVNREWWKYEIPQYFHAIKPSDIDEWDTDTILTHLAAVKEFKEREKEQQKTISNAFSGRRR